MNDIFDFDEQLLNDDVLMSYEKELDDNNDNNNKHEIDKTIFYCSEYRQSNSAPLSHLICIEQKIDRNATCGSETHSEVIIDAEFYIYLQFFCVHTFRNALIMFMYTDYRKIDIYDELIEDLGPRCDGFQNIMVLQHLCAKTRGHEAKFTLSIIKMSWKNV